MFPDLLIADGVRQLSLSDLCGTELVVRYTTCMHSIHMCSLDVTSQSEHYCSSIVLSDDTRKVGNIKVANTDVLIMSVSLHESFYFWHIFQGLLRNNSIEYEVIDQYTLTITSRHHPICISKLVVKTCETSNKTNYNISMEQSKRFTVQKRSAAPINQNLWKHDNCKFF